MRVGELLVQVRQYDLDRLGATPGNTILVAACHPLWRALPEPDRALMFLSVAAKQSAWDCARCGC
jgi:hypothetical protein